jgi:hypothetical protein
MEYSFRKPRRLQGTGSRLISSFIGDFQGEFRERVVKYGDYRLSDPGKDAFDQVVAYSEQQAKTCVTAALDAVCDSNLIQECPVDRKKPISKRKVVRAKGKLDYWCEYGEGTPIDILVEVKHGWIRYYKKNRHTVYAWAIDRHAEAVKQLRDIQDKRNLGDYAMALTILPVYQLTTKRREAGVCLDQNSLAGIVDGAAQMTGADRVWAFTLPVKQSKALFGFKDNDGVRRYESYPAVVLLWSILKIRRGR